MSPDVTALVAMYGAVVATLGAGWSIYRDIKVRSRRLRVSAFLGQRLGGVPMEHLVVKVTNVGAVPVVPAAIVITNGRGEKKKLYWLVADPPFSRLLQPGEDSGQVSNDLSKLVDPDLRIYVEDSFGKRWHLKRDEARELSESVQKKLSAPAVKKG
jgi:hypothetical protein